MKIEVFWFHQFVTLMVPEDCRSIDKVNEVSFPCPTLTYCIYFICIDLYVYSIYFICIDLYVYSIYFICIDLYVYSIYFICIDLYVYSIYFICIGLYVYSIFLAQWNWLKFNVKPIVMLGKT